MQAALQCTWQQQEVMLRLSLPSWLLLLVRLLLLAAAAAAALWTTGNCHWLG
jgi:hypothetical protein